jgi:hypothetical protein
MLTQHECAHPQIGAQHQCAWMPKCMQLCVNMKPLQHVACHTPRQLPRRVCSVPKLANATMVRCCASCCCLQPRCVDKVHHMSVVAIICMATRGRFSCFQPSPLLILLVVFRIGYLHLAGPLYHIIRAAAFSLTSVLAEQCWQQLRSFALLNICGCRNQLQRRVCDWRFCRTFNFVCAPICASPLLCVAGSV